MGNIVWITGAGVSAASGIPTYRDSNGLWKKVNPKEVATIERFVQNRRKVLEFFNTLKKEYLKAKPNKHHFLLKEIVNKHSVRLFTQNIDLLYEKAGLDKVVHIHGKINEYKCEKCGFEWTESEKDTFNCPECNSKKIRPKIVLFGESESFETYLMKKEINRLENGDAIVIQGTYGNVFPFARYISYLKNNYPRIKTYLNNLEPSPYLPEKLFDEIFYEESELATKKIVDSLLAEKII